MLDQLNLTDLYLIKFCKTVMIINNFVKRFMNIKLTKSEQQLKMFNNYNRISN